MLHDYHYYLGPWAWISDTEGERWSAPDGCIAAVDLRGLPAQELAGAYGDKPYGFFAATSPLASEYTPLGRGDCREIAVTGAMQDAWEALLGYRASGDWLVDLLWDQLTQGSDPSGDTPTSPLMPETGGRLSLHLPGHSIVRTERFEWGQHAHTAKVKDVLHRCYREAVKDERRKGGKSGHARRVLDCWCDKFRIQGEGWRDLVPPELRKGHPGRLPHETTLTDNFNRADSATLGTASGGGTWTEVSGNLDIISNQAGAGAIGADGATNARLESDLSSADHYAQIVSNAAGGDNRYQSGCCRFSPSAQTFYYGLLRGGAPQESVRKRVAGVTTDLVTGSTGHISPFTSRTEANGSTIRLLKNGTQILSVTDTAISGGTRTGMIFRATSTGERGDDWEAGDLSVSVARQFMHLARMRG